MKNYFVGTSERLLKEFEAHEHDTWEVILNLEGCGVIEIGNSTYEYRPGTVICIPPGMLHKKYSQEGFRDVFIWTDYFPGIEKGKEKRIYIFSDSEENSLRSLMLLLLQFHLMEDKKNSSVSLHLYYAVMTLISDRVHSENIPSSIIQMKNNMLSSFADPETNVTRLLKSTGYSIDHARRKFAEAFGMTPTEYLTQLRINNAKNLLTNNEFFQYSIEEIAIKSGFYDARYFSRIFKKETGLSPSQYLANIDLIQE